MALGFFEAVDPVEQAKNPNYVERRRKLIDAMRAERSKEPIRHWTQGVSGLVNTVADRYEEGQLAKGEKLGREEAMKDFMEYLNGAPVAASGVSPAGSAAPAPAAVSPSAAGAVPPGIFDRMIKQESGGRQFDRSGNVLTSSAGALGIAQIMPGTAPEAAKLAGLPLDMNRLKTDPNYNRALGQAYFKDQLRRFGDPLAAAAAYNAGPGAVNKAISRQDATGRPFSDFLPAETRNYMAVVGGGTGGAGSPQPVSGMAQAPTNIPPRPDGSPVSASQVLAQAAGVPGGGGVPQQASTGPGAMPAPAAGGMNNMASLARFINNPAAVQMIKNNPLLAAVLAKRMEGNKLSYQTLPDGTIIALDPSGRQPPRPVYQGPQKPVTLGEGQSLVSPTDGRVIAAGKAKDDRTTDQKNYKAYVDGLPQGQKAVPFGTWLESLKRAGSAAPESAFAVQNAKNLAEVFKGVSDEGTSAQTDLSNIKTLREQFNKIPGGIAGHLQGMASRYGIKIGEGAGAVEVADALINRLTPAQRQGMPGAASDRDVAMFRAALPSLMNTTQGRNTILDTMQAMAEYRMARGAISTQVQIGKMSPQDGIQALEKVPDPFAMFKKLQGGAGPAAGGQAPKVRVWNPATQRLEDQ